MAITLMPVMATCCQCRSKYPVGAVLPGGMIPLFVVIMDVDSVERALKNATCQLCLKKAGPSERGLHTVLTALGCTEVQANHGLSVDLHALAAGNKSTSGPSMIGVRVVMPRDPFRQSSRREERLDDRPRMPKVLEEPVVPEAEDPVEHLRVSLGDATSLRELRQRFKAKNTARFLDLMAELREEIGRIRSVALRAEVDDAVDVWLAKFKEAVHLDPEQRGRTRLMQILATSDEELEGLRFAFWATFPPRTVVKGCRLEEIEENPFPNGQRPRHFNLDDEGRQTALRPVIVVRAKSSLPAPNPPLTEPEGPRPKIIYPADGLYGPDCEVFWSRRGDLSDVVVDLFEGFPKWLRVHHEAQGITDRLARIDFTALVTAYFRCLMDERDEEEVVSSDVPSTNDQPHAEV